MFDDSGVEFHSKKRKQSINNATYDFDDGYKRKKGENLINKAASDYSESNPKFYMNGNVMRMLEKMRYKGGGLGKNEQGIVDPIEAIWRPKNLGLGFTVDVPESDHQQKLVKEDKPAALVRQEKVWKRKVCRQGSDELLLGREEEGPRLVVVDMRGPQVRVLTNLENLSSSNAQENEYTETDLPVVELLYNVRLLVDLAEVEVEKIDRECRNEKATVTALRKQKEMLQLKETLEKKQISDLEQVLCVLDAVEEERVSGRLTLESLANSVRLLQTRFPEEYKICNLSWVAAAYALPLLIRLFRGWEPLESPSHGVDVIALWRSLLQGDEPQEIFEDVNAPYCQLVSEVVFPAVRTAGINKWQARDPEPMLRLVETWEKLLPSCVLQSILDMIVMPKLSEAVKSWDPCTESIPIHVWIHPWLPLLGQKVESLCQLICTRFGNALQHWHPSKTSAYTILSPWKTVFDAATWEHLVVRSILPKLITVMQEFQVNPADQKLEPFHWVMAWASAVPIHHMIRLLEIHFFSKWQQVLYHWLCSSPNYEEVVQWYLGWKELIPAELLSNERVRHQLNIALDMMNRAVEGLEILQPGVKENISYLKVREQRQFEAGVKAQQQASAANSVPEMSLKELIEGYAQENGILFAPKPGRLHNHHQVYSFGSVSVYVDSLNQKLFAQVQGQWSSVSLELLLQMQK